MWSWLGCWGWVYWFACCGFGLVVLGVAGWTVCCVGLVCWWVFDVVVGLGVGLGGGLGCWLHGLVC